MSLICALLLAAVAQEDRVSLAREYRAGETDIYTLRVSPPGKLAPLSNPSRLVVNATKGRFLSATLDGRPAAKWTVAATGLPLKVISITAGVEFLPWAFVLNDVSLQEGQMQALPTGSVKLLKIKDSAAQVKAWQDLPGFSLETRALVEVAGRVPDQIDGTIYHKASGQLQPWRAFRLERIRTRPVPPVPQDDGD